MITNDFHANFVKRTKHPWTYLCIELLIWSPFHEVKCALNFENQTRDCEERFLFEFLFWLLNGKQDLERKKSCKPWYWIGYLNCTETRAANIFYIASANCLVNWCVKWNFKILLKIYKKYTCIFFNCKK